MSAHVVCRLQTYYLFKNKQHLTLLPTNHPIKHSTYSPILCYPKIVAEIPLQEQHPFPPNAMRRNLDSSWIGGFSLGIDLGLSRTGLAISKGFSVRPLKVLELRGQKLEMSLIEIAQQQAFALSLQHSSGFLDVESKTPPQRSDANATKAENFERKQSVRKDDSAKWKRKNLFTSRVQMTEDELILHFFQFDEAGKGGINLRDLQRVAASHDFTWKDEEMEHMINFFDSDGDGKLSLEDFTKIVERCNMRQGSENAERTSIAS